MRLPTVLKEDWFRKLLLSFIFAFLIVLIVAMDFREGDSPLTPTQKYNVKAPLLALLGAMVLFLKFLPVRNEDQSKITHIVMSLTSMLGVTAAAWFWLLGATNGDPMPYLVQVLPWVVFAIVGLVVTMVLSYYNTK